MARRRWPAMRGERPAQLSERFSRALFVAVSVLSSLAMAQAPSRDVELGAAGLQTPQVLQGVGVDERLGALLPLDLPFVDDNGRQIKLSDLFFQNRPLIVSLNYSRCPMLCNVQLTGLVDSLRQISWTPGREFEVVSVSMDPKETTEQARKAKAGYVRAYGRAEAESGFHFLTGREGDVRKLAEALGVQYQYDRSTDQFAHMAVFAVASPDGRIVRYMYGKEFPPLTLRLTLADAVEGKVGSTIDRVVFWCYSFDHASGTYTVAAFRLMQVGMGATAAIVAVVLMSVWLRHRRRSSVGIAHANV